MRQYLLFILFLLSHNLVAQIQTDNVTPYKHIIFGVTKGFGNSIGSAFIVGKSSEYYFLATAKHVVQGDEKLLLTSLKGSQYPATVVTSHAVHDLALLRTPIFDLDLEAIPIVINLSMNDEVAFVSVKDSGKILPSKSPGIVRDVNGESVSVIMKEVESGHSGSPLISSTGIAGMITKNGKFIECINIVLVKEILEEWGDDLFKSLFSEHKLNRINLNITQSSLGSSEEPISIKDIIADESCTAGVLNLTDRYLNTSWSCSCDLNDISKLRIGFYQVTSILRLDIYISDESTSQTFPHEISVFNDYEINFLSLKHSKRQGNGYWYSYEFNAPYMAKELTIGLNYDAGKTGSVTFSEILFYGIAL